MQAQVSLNQQLPIISVKTHDYRLITVEQNLAALFANILCVDKFCGICRQVTVEQNRAETLH